MKLYPRMSAGIVDKGLHQGVHDRLFGCLVHGDEIGQFPGMAAPATASSARQQQA